MQSLKKVGIPVIRNFIETVQRKQDKKKKNAKVSKKQVEEQQPKKKLEHRNISGFDIGGEIPEFGLSSPKNH